MAIDWSIARQPNALAMMMQGYDEGVKLRREEKSRAALNSMLGPGYGDMTPEDARTAVTFRKAQADLASSQQEQVQAQAQQIGRLLRAVKADQSKYGNARAAAIQMGIPASKIPETYNPEWADQQLMIADAFEKDGGAGPTSTMKELVALGYKVGTPEFAQALAQAMNAEYAKPYVDQEGRTRLHTPNIAVPAQAAPQQAPHAPQQEPLTYGQFKAYADVQGLPKAAEWARQNGLSIRVNTPQEAEQLPRGTRIILPDGSEGVVP